MKKNSILIFCLMVAGLGCAAMLTANVLIGRPQACASLVEECSMVNGQWSMVNSDTLDLKPIGVNDHVAIDSTFFEEYDSLEQARLDSVDSSPRVYSLHLMARAYKDHITLRWAPSGYVPWRYLQDDGFLLERIHIDDEKGVVFDTLGTFKPLTVEQFKARFAENDTLAGAAVSLLYSRNVRTTGQTDAAPGSMKSIVELHEEQENRAGFTMLLADLRPDLADAMGLRYEDHTVKPGTEYSYFLHPLTPDTLLRIHSAYVINIVAGKSEQEKFNPVITDSISRPQSLKLFWPRQNYTAYTIERREKGKREWTLLTDQPYIPFANAEVGDSTMHFYVDSPDPGTYEYRITAIDAFGEKTEPSDPHEVTMPDLIPPLAPYIKRILLHRRDETHGTADVMFDYTKGQQRDEKTIGYHIFYNNPTLFGDSLVQMTTTMIAPTDTVGTITIDNLPTGFLTIAAYDKNGNQGLSAPQMIRIDDLVPPHAPTNLRAHVAPDGFTVLRWSPVPDRDLSFYEVYMANDTTHTFMNIAPPELRDTAFIDSLALGLNQKYIYYKLKAVDWSGNQSEFSELLQVLRPNFAPPSVCRIDSVAIVGHDSQRDNSESGTQGSVPYYDDYIYMRWIQSSEVDIERSRLFRRLEDSIQWTLVGVYDADSVRREGNFIRVTDRPTPNMKQRYVYCMETQNASGVSSGMSLPQTFLFTGPRIVDIKLTLAGTFHSKDPNTTNASNAKTNVTHLAWDCGKVPDYGPYYFCIYRKGPDDDSFKFLLSAKSTDREFQDYLLRPGQTAQYYITVQYDDGRRSRPSNTITVEAKQ